MYLYVFLLISLLNLTFHVDTYASYHFTDEGDEDFINLGKQFPSVGYFSLPSEPSFGSGTLVDVGIPELANQVVITCAHIFDEEDSNEAVFTCGDEEPVKGKAFIHPQYTEVYKKYEWAPSSHDIAAFVLEKPLLSILSVQPERSPYEELINKHVIQVGYGITGHFLGKFDIVDQEKRASYSYVHSAYNKLQNVEKILTFSGATEGACQVNFTFPTGAQLNVTPWKALTFINNEPIMEFLRRPSGLACSGDSGGGCFSEGGLFLGVISSGHIGNFEREPIIKRKHYQKYRNVFDADFAELEKSAATLQKNEEVKRPIIVSDINPYFTPFYQANSASAHQFLIADGEIALFSFHKEWIIETLKTHLATVE